MRKQIIRVICLNRCVTPGVAKMSAKQRKKKEVNVEETTTHSPVCVNKNGQVSIRILAKPGSKVNAITGLDAEGVGVQISAAPVEGEANTELVKYMAKVLGLRKTDVSLDKGSRSRNKTILLSKGCLTEEEVVQKLKTEQEAG